MRQSMTIRLDSQVLASAKACASKENRTLTNYIETLLVKDIAMSQNHSVADQTDESEEIQIFIAVPVTKRLITEVRDTDTPEVTAARQNILDIVTGFRSASDE